MRILATPRAARDLKPKQLRQASGHKQRFVDAAERDRLTDVLLRADPGLMVIPSPDDRVVLVARGRSGVRVTLGPVWHEAELPDWHDGTAGTWLAERYLTVLRTLARFTGGRLFYVDTDRPVDIEDPAQFVGQYRARSQPREGAPLMPRLKLAPGAAESFLERSEAVLRRRGASVADRAWFLASAVRSAIDRDHPAMESEIRWDPSTRTVYVVDLGRSSKTPLIPTVVDPVPPVPEGLEEKDRDVEAIEYLSGLFSYSSA